MGGGKREGKYMASKDWSGRVASLERDLTYRCRSDSDNDRTQIMVPGLGVMVEASQ